MLVVAGGSSDWTLATRNVASCPRFYPAVLPSLVPLLLGGWFKLLFSCTFLWIWNKGLGKLWLFWQGAVPLFPLSISQIVPDAAKAAKTQDLQGSGMESSGMQISIVLTILKCLSRYYLIFCPFCPFFSTGFCCAWVSSGFASDFFFSQRNQFLFSGPRLSPLLVMVVYPWPFPSVSFLWAPKLLYLPLTH